MAWTRLEFRSLKPPEAGAVEGDAVVVYEHGPHAPMRVVAHTGAPRARSMEDLGGATVGGPALAGEVVLGCAGDSCRHNISQRIPLRVGGADGSIQRPRFGPSFSSRIIEIEAGTQRWAVVPTWGPIELRRGGVNGEPVATRSARRREVSDEATAEEVALALLLETEGGVWNSTRILVRLLFGWLQGV
jgi:hypothetical protein